MLESGSKFAAHLSPAVREAVAHHAERRLPEAARCCQRALAENPADAEALLLLGLLARQMGQHGAAVALSAEAVRLRPQNPGFHLLLAQANLSAGNADHARASCRRALELSPSLSSAWCLMGDLAWAQGDLPGAQQAWETVARLDGSSARAERLLGHLLCRQGEFEQAIEVYRRGLGKAPHDALLHYALGAALAERGNLVEAKSHCEEALRLRPNFAEAQLNLGNLHYDEGRFAIAALCYRKALALRPAYAKAWCNLGNALQMLGGAREAARCYERTLALDPQLVAAQHNLGNALMARRDFRRAEECFRRSVAMDETRAEHHSSLGNALFQQRRNAEAEACYRRALALDPRYAIAHTNLANVLMRQTRREEMICHYERALQLDPSSAGGHYNLALACLREGRYSEGWAHHEWRWDFRELKLRRRRLAVPQWQGEPLGGETILLHAEQGLGDTLQFVRYAPLVTERGGRVILEVQSRLARLLRGMPGVDRVVVRGDPLPEIARHCPLMSLPQAFATTIDTLPQRIPYVRAAPQEAAAAFARWPGAGLRIGIAWAGNPQHRSDRQRSMPLRALVPLAEVPGITWFSLQMGPACGQMPALARKFSLVDASSESRDFAETAALLATLDLVISVDTSVAHLAGAMGIPLWVVLPQFADWRWMDEREDSPWYPTARLFRQPTGDDWAAPVERMRDELRKIAQPRGSGASDLDRRTHGRLEAEDAQPSDYANMLPQAASQAMRVTGCGAGMGPG